ncbi:MAG: NAD-dependent epimerase/dehydratase family protein [Planctomycetota bacterium]
MPETAARLPKVVANEADLEALLSRPSPALVNMMKRLDGDIMLLGVAGKIGPDLALTALKAIKKAGVDKKLIGVDLFPEEESRALLENSGVELIACDLLNPAEVAALPRARNVIYLVGRKFGTQGNEELTWMINVVAPANAARHFSESRIVAFSTGCVYPMVGPAGGGCVETDQPGPLGEYAQSCLGRERVFEYYSKANSTPVSLIRLNYAVDLRYGVLYDIGKLVLEGKPIDLTMGYFNAIWQGDVNNQTLLALEHCTSPPAIWNVTRPEVVSIRRVAEQFAEIMGKRVEFTGEEGPVALLSNSAKATKVFGPPTVLLEKLIHWQAHWLMAGGRSLNKPTHFEETGGEY